MAFNANRYSFIVRTNSAINKLLDALTEFEAVYQSEYALGYTQALTTDDFRGPAGMGSPVDHLDAVKISAVIEALTIAGLGLKAKTSADLSTALAGLSELITGLNSLEPPQNLYALLQVFRRSS